MEDVKFYIAIANFCQGKSRSTKLTYNVESRNIRRIATAPLGSGLPLRVPSVFNHVYEFTRHA